MSKPIIATDTLCKVFGRGNSKQQVLNNVDFSIFPGEMVAIVGPSGSGKSTLLSILGLLDEQTSGDYQLCGQAIDTLSTFQKSVLRNKHIGWIFQNFNLVGDMTVAENIVLPLTFDKTLKKSQYSEKVSNVLKKVGLHEKAGSFPSELSGGQQQRVAIARALITEPEILLCDEPTGNLDSENAELVMQLFHEFHQENCTILLITHSAEISEQCQKIYRINDGKLVLTPATGLKNVV
ncbi:MULTISPECIES: ABC transporter ATP-binding protein [unclassified Colwellia]|uniref:ABC transporter ATP-binding protein n=1 Tax=unclassified Colwellia TaxID=196834 RepID=UPI0015F688FF|nr:MULTISPECIES: ABC transporter ATP-binding protein [unclassified Colwellia]MBA6231578.1 ABC transporter ATP-binding protein [Colwellia sp. MB02u-7]MBA6235442.1 ABC transporter ATP-binding protein [Colwellia sp. MB02u-11]MBA6299858.1 ABC transporter ATP-binding protein [Colwellia sp. MB3u-22]MBA6310816.1 ABC transporter ATP-binding protein [Colwellia sp. MB3u-64]